MNKANPARAEHRDQRPPAEWSEWTLPVGSDGRTNRALTTLADGYRRFVDGTSSRHASDRPNPAGRPVAVVFECADRLWPAELLFDSDDLMVVGTLGHRLGSAVLAGIEYAVCERGAPLVIVLGHTPCDAPDFDNLLGVAPAHRPSGRPALDRRPLRVASLLQQHSPALRTVVADGGCAVVALTQHLDTSGAAVVRQAVDPTPVRP